MKKYTIVVIIHYGNILWYTARSLLYNGQALRVACLRQACAHNRDRFKVLSYVQDNGRSQCTLGKTAELRTARTANSAQLLN